MNQAVQAIAACTLAVSTSSALAYHIDFNASYSAPKTARNTAFALVQSGGCPRAAFRNLSAGSSSQYTASGSFCKPYGLWTIFASQHEHINKLSDIWKWPHIAQMIMVDNMDGGNCQINFDQDIKITVSGNCHLFPKA